MPQLWILNHFGLLNFGPVTAGSAGPVLVPLLCQLRLVQGETTPIRTPSLNPHSIHIITSLPLSPTHQCILVFLCCDKVSACYHFSLSPLITGHEHYSPANIFLCQASEELKPRKKRWNNSNNHFLITSTTHHTFPICSLPIVSF